MTALQALRFLCTLVISVFFLGAMLSLTERLVLVHISHYPHWFSTGSFATLAPGSLSHLRDDTCGAKQEIDIFEKRDEWVFRCGDFWPRSKTFTAPRSPNNDRIIHSPEDF